MVAYPGLGGSGIVASELAHNLAMHGHQVWMFATERPFRLPTASPVQFVPVDVPHYPVFPSPLYTLALAGTLDRGIRELDLELIHTHYAVPHAAAAWLATEAAQHAIPLVHTLHGTDVRLLGSHPSYREITRQTLRRAAAVTAVSHNLASQAEEVFGLSPRVIYNAVDAHRFVPRPERKAFYAESGEWLLVHASNFRPIKRITDVVGAFARVRKEVRAKLLLLGDGPDKPKAQRMVKRLGLEGCVRFMEADPHPEDVVGAADLFLLASEEESFGQAAIEALACGVPVVSSRVGGVPEWLTPNVGRMFEIGDVQGFAETVLNLLYDPEYPQMRQKARPYAIERFSPETITAQYLALYQEAVERPWAVAG